MTEAGLMRAIQLAASRRGHRLFRFNVGLFQTADGRAVRTGVVGASDLIGISASGRFLAVEVKLPGRKPTRPQAAWLAMVERQHGIAGVAHSVDEAMAIIGEG